MMVVGDSLGIATAGYTHSVAGVGNSLSVTTWGFHADCDSEKLYPRHYPRLRELGDFDAIYPPGNNFGGDKQIDLLVKARALDIADDAASDVRREMCPLTAVKSLSSWETFTRSYNTSGMSISARREAVSARLRARGGQSFKYYKSIVEALGYTYGTGTAKPIWFIEGGGGFRYFRAGFSRAGDEVFGLDANVEKTVTVMGSQVEGDSRLVSLFRELRYVGIKVVFKNA